MTAKELRAAILQLAIQGKLVTQRKEEGTARELLAKIAKERETRSKKSSTSKSRAGGVPANPVSPGVPDVPFEIPASWAWVRLGEVCALLNTPQSEGETLPLWDAKALRGQKTPQVLRAGRKVLKGDNIILVDGENSGEMFVAPKDGYMGSTFKAVWFSNEIFVPYVLTFIEHNRTLLRNNKRGAAIPHLDKAIFFNLPIPLPPLAEQRRIVAKIEELRKIAKKLAGMGGR